MTRQTYALKIPVHHVIAVTARTLSVSVGDILNRNGKKPIAFARGVAIAVTCEVRPDLAFETIGRCFRGRDRKTIAAHWEAMRRRIQAESEVAALVARVRKEVLTWTPPPPLALLVEKEATP